MTLYRTIFEKAAEGILIAELESHCFRYANPAICKMLGYTEDELLRKRAQDIHPKEELDIVLAEFNNLAQGTKTSVNEIPCLRKDGTVIYADISGSQINIDNIACNLGFFTDSTDHKKAKFALQEFASRQQALLAAIPDIIMEVDCNKIYTWANRQGLEFFGDDVIGKKADFYFEGDQDINAKVEALFRGDENTVYLESLQRRCDGQKRMLAWWCQGLKDGQGNVNAAISSARDITEREEAEEALSRASKLLETVTKGTDVIIASVDTKFCYTYFNAAYQKEFRNLTGREVSIGMSMVDLLSHMPELQAIVVDQWGRSLQGENFNKKIELNDADRHRRVYRTLQTPLVDNDGIVVGAGAVAYDITSQVIAEEELRESQEQIKTLSGLLPICANCKKIRNDGGYWERIEAYISKHTDAQFSHGICPECAKKLYPELYDEKGGLKEYK
jgi:PAS domain S-box-containing protein